MADPWLSPEALYRLTGKRRSSAQISVLIERKIPFVQGAKGKPLVREDYLDGKPGRERNREPRMDLVNS